MQSSSMENHKEKNVEHVEVMLKPTDTLQLSESKIVKYGKFFPNLDSKSIVVVSQPSSSTNLLKVTYLSKKQCVDFILNPSEIDPQFTNVVQISTTGIIKPFHLPDLSDLALLPTPLKIFYTWYIKESKAIDILTRIDTIMSMCYPQLPLTYETVILSKGSYHFDMSSLSDFLKIMKLDLRQLHNIHIKARSKSITADLRDGRRLEVDVDVRSEQRGKCEFRKQTTDVLIWNCKGMALECFPTRMKQLINAVEPDLLIIGETRVTKTMCKWIMKDYPSTFAKVAEPQGLSGGITVIGLSNNVLAKSFKVSTNKWMGIIHVA